MKAQTAHAASRRVATQRLPLPVPHALAQTSQGRQGAMYEGGEQDADLAGYEPFFLSREPDTGGSHTHGRNGANGSKNRSHDTDPVRRRVPGHYQPCSERVCIGQLEKYRQLDKWLRGWGAGRRPRRLRSLLSASRVSACEPENRLRGLPSV